MKTFLSFAGWAGFFCLLIFVVATPVSAGSATWKRNPGNDWNTAANWTPVTVPNGPADTASFAASNNPAAALSAVTEVSQITFRQGASTYNITSNPEYYLTLSGAGIVNNSGVTQNFIVNQTDQTSDRNGLDFTNSATAGVGTAFTVVGGVQQFVNLGGVINFWDTSSADHGTFEIFGSWTFDAAEGEIGFTDNSTAANGTFVVHSGANDGNLHFSATATAGNAVITNEGTVEFNNLATAGNSSITNSGFLNFLDSATGDQMVITNTGEQVSGDFLYGRTEFDNNSSMTTGTITSDGGASAGANGGQTLFWDGASAGGSTLIANGGSNQGNGGLIIFAVASTGGTARVEIFGNGKLDISTHNAPGVTIGSLEGDGLVSLGANTLTIGTNNSNTTFEGVIDGSGGLFVSQSARLTLTGANTYTGGTVIDPGAVIANNSRGSATGSGPVLLKKDTLGGRGIIAGTVSIGDGGGPKAYLEPSLAAKQATLTILSQLTFKADGSYNYKINPRQGTSDKVIANGVVIERGSKFRLNTITEKKLDLGTVFTALDNTAATPINGVFDNLPEGAILQAGNNNLQASYHGGDGNDLTLTTVP